MEDNKTETELDKLMNNNYDSIVKRGLISEKTTKQDFIVKIEEEVKELGFAYFKGDKENFNEELADIILVCLNAAKHFNIDIEKELKDKIKINYKR